MERELKDQRVTLMMAPSELAAVDDWSFSSRIRSRGEAIRQLCMKGLLPGRQDTTIVTDAEVYKTKARTTIGFTSPNGIFSVRLSNELLAKLVAEASEPH